MSDHITLPVVAGDVSLSQLRSVLEGREIEALVVSYERKLHLMTRGRLEHASAEDEEAGPFAKRMGRRLRGGYKSRLRLHRLAPAKTWRVTPRMPEDLLLKMVTPPGLMDVHSRPAGSPIIGAAILSTRSEMIALSLRSPIALVVCAGRRRHVWDAASRYRTCPSDGTALQPLDL